MKKQTVIFRKMIGTGLVVALFPEYDKGYGECICRHIVAVPRLNDPAIANYQHMINRSRPATPSDAQDLLKELRQAGYDNVVRQKYNKRKKGTRQ